MPSAGWVKQLELMHCLFGMQMLLLKTIWQFLVKVNIHSLYNPAILLLGKYPGEMKTMYIQKPACECLSRHYSQSSKTRSPQCLSAGKWINKWYIHTMYYNSAIKKKNEVLIQATTRRNLKCILLSEKSQTSKNYVLCDDCKVLFIWLSGKGKTIGMDQ